MITVKDIPVIGFSGKFGSGKDFVAETILDELSPGWEHISFAKALKDEASNMYVQCEHEHCRPNFGYLLENGEVLSCPIIETPRPIYENGEAAPIVFDVEPTQCQEPAVASGEDVVKIPTGVISKTIWKTREYVGLNDARSLVCGSTVHDPVDAWSRSVCTRRINQWHGTEVRRAEDADYWAKRGMEFANVANKNGAVVAFTDVRFPNEADAIRNADGVVIRLTISEQVRDERLFKRDGHLPPAGASNHPSEISLDDYTDFDLIVSNDGALEDTLTKVAAFLNSVKN